MGGSLCVVLLDYL